MEIRPEREHVSRERHPDEEPLRRTDVQRIRGEVSFNPFTSFVFSLARFATLGGLISLLLAAGAFVLWIANGAAPVRKAARDTYSAEDAWFSTLNQTQPIIRELNLRGAPRGDLETVFFAYQDAPLANKALNADVLLQVMQDQVVAVRSMGHDTDPVVEMLYPPTRARGLVSEKYEDWLEATKPFSAQIAISAGLASPPEMRLERYARGPRTLQQRSNIE